jgi:PiT family inorganic phosphate transporter
MFEGLAEVPVALWIAGGLALYMAWAIGANDVANAMGTSVGSGALTLWSAVGVAAVFEFAGAYFVGGHVTDTVRKKMLDVTIVSAQPDLLLYGMLAALAAAATLLVIATFFGLPVSTTHSIVGAIVGFGMVAFGLDAIEWGTVVSIILSWGTSPLIGGVLAFLVFRLIATLILDRPNPLAESKRYGPIFFFFVFFIIALVTLFKGLKNLNLDYGLGEAALYASLFGLLGMAVGRGFILHVAKPYESGVDSEVDQSTRMEAVEKVFIVLQILTACALAFAHGSNDVANAIGPLAAAVNVLEGGSLESKATVAPWMLMVGGFGIIVGLATWGYRVIETVGNRITELTPSRGFAAQLAAATTIVLASRVGIPVSTTHILVGGVLGVGLARGIAALDLRVVGRIMASWVATLPIAGCLSIGFFYLFKFLLG